MCVCVTYRCMFHLSKKAPLTQPQSETLGLAWAQFPFEETSFQIRKATPASKTLDLAFGKRHAKVQSD